MKKFKITKGNRVYIVDAKSHIDAISKVKAVKDSSIKDYSPEVYINELEKLIPQYQRLDELRHKIIESLENTNKINNDTWRKYDYLSDAKVKQYIKQVRELDKKWNSITSNLNRFNIDPYNQRLDVSDRDIWFDNLPDKSTVDSIKYAVERKAKKYKSSEDIWKDSISQWNPGMSEIGLFQISYKRNGVYQSILVRANSEEQAKQKLLNNLNGVDIIGVNSHPSPHFHEPILDSNIKDINQVLLSNLEQVAQKGDAWRNKWKKLLDMTDKWNSYQWKELRNNDPKKYELIIRNKEYAEKEAEALNREWDRAIDALSRDRSFGRPGDYRMDLHSYKSRNDNYPMGNSQRYDEILYGYEQAEKSAREKKGLDSSIKDDGYYYLLRDAIDLLTKPGAARSWSQPYLEEVQEYMVQKGINPTNVNQWKKKYESLTKDSSIKDAWSGIRSNGVIFNYSNGKYTITHKNGKVETFPGNKFNSVEELFKYIDNIKDSTIKDMPLMFKSNVNMQSLKSNIDNVKNKPNETYINSLNANIQGIIADIEEIKGYEKEGKFNESPALKFSCKNLTAQYYKLLNDPKLQGTLHKLDEHTYKNVLYAEHQAQMLSQVTLK